MKSRKNKTPLRKKIELYLNLVPVSASLKTKLSAFVKNRESARRVRQAVKAPAD